MNLNKFTEKAQEAVLTAQNLASEGTHAEITPEHLLVALVEQREGVVPELLRKMNADPGAIDMFDLSTKKTVATVPIPAQPTGIAILRK